MRLLERLEQLYAIGGGPGANRIGYHRGGRGARPRARLARGGRSRGRASTTAGNLLGHSRRRPGDRRSGPGSHLDTVPQGRAVRRRPRRRRRDRGGRARRAAGRSSFPRRGARLRRPRLRSRARSGRSRRLPRGAHRAGPAAGRAGRAARVVTGIVGYARGEVVVEGAAGHAGTTPMASRDDALVKAAEFVLRFATRRRRSRTRSRRSAGSRPSRARERDPRRVRFSSTCARPTGAARRPRRLRSGSSRAPRRAGGGRVSARCGRRSRREACRSSSSSPARATTRACSPRPACRRDALRPQR